MKATNAFFLVGMTAAALGLGAVYATGAYRDDAPKTATAPEAKANKDTAPDATNRVEATPSVEANASPTPVYPEGQPTWAELNDYTKYQTLSQFVDVIRSSHIAVGTVTAVQYPSARVEITFQPTYYIKGTDVGQGSIQIRTDSNADLRELVGQNIAVAFLEGTRDGKTVYGLSHGFNSVTREVDNIDASVAFYTDMLEIFNRYQDGVLAGLEVNPEDGRFPFPEAFVTESKQLLLNSLGDSLSAAAHSAIRELCLNPLFSDAMTNADLVDIADAVRNAQPWSYVRGYGLMTLDQHAYPNFTIEDAMKIVRDETRMVNIDHLATYLNHHQTHGLVVPALASIYSNESMEETPQAIRNALEATWIFGDKLSLPYMDSVLGKLTERSQQRAILKAYGGMHDPRNLEPLVVYLNGGIPSETHGSVASKGEHQGVQVVRKQSDCLDSVELMKRTILAIAMIDSPDSNMLLRQMHTMARDQWLQDYLVMLREENKDWRILHEILEEGDKSARAIAGK